MRQFAIAIVLAGFAALAALVIFRRAPKRSGPDRIPPALRPGDTDEVLESERLTKIMRNGFIVALFFAIFLPVYWLAEPGRMIAKEQEFAEESIARGAKYYALRTDPVSGEQNLSGKECAQCHGVKAEGGENDFLNPATGTKTKVKVPELQTVFSRYEKPPLGFKDARTFVYETIERGRPGTDMPTWGNKFGGPLTEQEVNDIVNWLFSIQRKAEVKQGATGQQIFTEFCAACHGIGGTGGSGPSMTGGSENLQFPNIEDHIAFVKNGSKPGTYGKSGKGTGGMPPWGGTLTDEQIRLVVEYERSL